MFNNSHFLTLSVKPEPDEYHPDEEDDEYDVDYEVEAEDESPSKKSRKPQKEYHYEMFDCGDKAAR